MKEIYHCGTVSINTDRLCLRAFTLTDSMFLFQNLFSDKALTKELCLNAIDTPEQTKEQLRLWLKNYLKADFYKWAVVDKESNAPIGLIELHNMDDFKGCCELGFWIEESHAKMGYATEAAQAVLSLCFLKLGLREVCALCFCGNAGAVRVFEKLGMQKSGMLKGHLLTPDGEIKDCLLYSILNNNL